LSENINSGPNVVVERITTANPFDSHPDHIDTILYDKPGGFTVKAKNVHNPKRIIHSDRPLLRGTDESVELDSASYSTYITIPIYMGSNREYNDVLVDTGSDRIVVMGYTCSLCAGTTYDY
jgi:hypothetical protein